MTRINPLLFQLTLHTSWVPSVKPFHRRSHLPHSLSIPTNCKLSAVILLSSSILDETLVIYHLHDFSMDSNYLWYFICIFTRILPVQRLKTESISEFPSLDFILTNTGSIQVFYWSSRDAVIGSIEYECHWKVEDYIMNEESETSPSGQWWIPFLLLLFLSKQMRMAESEEEERL